MSATTMSVQTRPFSIEPITGVMLTDGMFDTVLRRQRIACHFTNTGSTDLTDVDIYLESVADPGIVVTGRTIKFPRIAAGASVLVWWEADFSAASPGKPLVSFVAQAAGRTAARSLRNIFVSETRYDSASNEYSIRVPEGRLVINQFRGTRPTTPIYLPNPQGQTVPVYGPWIPVGVDATWYPDEAYAGIHGELPFADPWWKALIALILLLIALAVAIATSYSLGTGMGTPATPGVPPGCVSCAVTLGVVGYGIAAAFAAAAVIVALNDDADPWWRGQSATPPAKGELTVSEHVKADWELLDHPIAGTPIPTHVRWDYTRVITGATYSYSVDETQTNIHLVEDVNVSAPATVRTGQALWVKARFKRPGGVYFTGPGLYAFAIFEAPGGRRFQTPLVDDGTGFDSPANDGWYTGGFAWAAVYKVLKAAGEPIHGKWKVYVFAQDVNRVPPGTPPQIAAQTIGGIVVASAIRFTLDDGTACPTTTHALIDVVA